MKQLLLWGLVLTLTTTFAQTETKKDSVAADSVPKKWTVNGKITFLVNQSSFSNWAAGGVDNIAGNLGLNYDFNYKNGNWNWDNKVIATYGLSYIDEQGVRKTDDRFEYNTLLGLKAAKYWNFSFLSNFKTQHNSGYDYNQEPKVKVSDFFAPAYWNFGPGMLWKKSDKQYVNIAPASARFTFVTREFSGKYGVKEGKTSVFGLGFNLSAYFKNKIGKNVELENILAMYSDYLENPEKVDIDYRVNLFVKINEYLSTNLGLHTIVDENASAKVQFKQIFGLGLNYVFHKK